MSDQTNTPGNRPDEPRRPDQVTGADPGPQAGHQQGPQRSGSQGSGSQGSGPQRSGPQGSGPQRSGSQGSGPQTSGPQHRGPHPIPPAAIPPETPDELGRDLADPIDVVKAALDGTPLSRQRRPAGAPAAADRGVSAGPPAAGDRGAAATALGGGEGPPILPRRGAAGGGARGAGARRPGWPRPGFTVNWRWVRRGVAAVVALVVLVPLVTFGMAYAIVEVPKPGDIRTAQVSTILASDGTELAKIIPPEGNRIDVSIDQVPQHVRAAVMAAEDRDFYTNPGFSFSGFARALKNNVVGGDTQGGSTITQQYVKNALVGDARSGMGGLVRKAKELVISTKMSREWSKDQVMEAYLNIIYFGRGAYGISAASQAYFGKPVNEVTVSEGALLAALIQRPSTLDPAVDHAGAMERWNWVLDGMVTIGALSGQDRAQQVFPTTIEPEQASQENQTVGANGLIERQVVRELMTMFNISEQQLNTEGLQVTTTIDSQAQNAAVDAVTSTLSGQDPDMRAALVSVDPRTGGVRAYYGGSDANGFDFAQAGLPTGSSFKVFALIAALEQGIGLGYQVDSSELWVNGIKISNVEGEGCGTCNIAEALKRSLNTSFYRLMMKLKNGPEDVADAAHRAGIAASFPGVPHTLSEDGQGGPPNNGVVLGQYQTRVLDMASAYATLAASGVYRTPHFVQKVVNSDGQVLYDAGAQDNPGEQRIEKAVADNVTAAMAPIAGWSRGHNLAGGRASAAKTGTNQLGDTGGNRDAWMVGFTPSLSTAVWVGTTAGDKPLVNKWGGPVYGSGLPSDIWKATMDGALKGTDNEAFPKPTEIGGYAGVPVIVAPPPKPVVVVPEPVPPSEFPPGEEPPSDAPPSDPLAPSPPP